MESSNFIETDQKTRQYLPTILVKTTELCQEIIDMGYLKNLKDVCPARYDPSRRVYFFDDIPEIRNYVNQYIEEKRNKYAERNAERFKEYN